MHAPTQAAGILAVPQAHRQGNPAVSRSASDRRQLRHHKTAAVKRWLKAHSRFHLHFTPTSSSWLNMVERFFAKITEKRIRRGTFKSVAELESAIMHYLQNHNANPEPFVWTKSAGDILRKVAGAKQALESVH
jgi:transposase